MTLRQQLIWQRIPVSAMRIDHPRSESRFWLVFAVAYVLVAILIGWIIRASPHPFFGAASLTNDAWYIFVFKLFLLLAVPLGLCRRMGYRARDLTPGWRPNARAWRVIVMSYAVGFLPNLNHLSPIVGAYGQSSTLEYTARIGFAVVVPFFMAGFPEEFVYRGFLQTRLEAVWGRLPAVLTTAVLFTAWHLPTRYFAAHGVEGRAGDLSSVLMGTGLPVFVVGLIFGLIWDRYRSFWPLVACHTGVDTLPTISSMLHIVR